MGQSRQGADHLKGAAHGIEQRNAEGEKGRGHGAHDEIFQTGLVGAGLPLTHRNEDVQGQGEGLKAQKKDDPVQGPGHQNHAQSGKEEQAVKFIAAEASGPGVFM